MSDEQSDERTGVARYDEQGRLGYFPAPAVSAPIAERVLELAAREGVNEAILDKLIAWQEREAALQAEERFNDAMARVQSEIAPVVKSIPGEKTGTFYANLEAIDKAISPVYLRHGFSVSYDTVPPLKEGNIRVECAVSLGRHTKRFYREAPADTLGPKGAPVKTVLQGGGSTETYLKRYALCGAFNVKLVGMDDDGKRGGMKFISHEQALELADLIAETKTQENTFLSVMYPAGNVHRIEEAEARDYPRLHSALSAKKRQIAARQQQKEEDEARAKWEREQQKEQEEGAPT